MFISGLTSGFALTAMSGIRNPYEVARLGVLREGACADLLSVDGDPTRDIEMLKDHERNLAPIDVGGYADMRDTGQDPGWAWSQREFSYSAKGKLLLGGVFARSEMHFNLAHSDDLAAFAVGPPGNWLCLHDLAPAPGFLGALGFTRH